MNNIDLRNAPYYQSSKDLDYTQLLFKPGMHLQGAEVNELQDREKRIVRDIADSLLKDGDILAGVQIIINDKIVTVTEGKIYAQGIVRYNKQQSVTIAGIGQEIVGVKLVKEIIDSSKDVTLLSPAAGFENYNLAGADRLKETLILTVNDPDAIPLFILVDGELVNDIANEDGSLWDRFLSILARRTYDESGHYKVYGNELSQKNQYSEDFLYLTMSEGKSYVSGWEIDKRVATTIPIERAISTRKISSEPKVYTIGTNKYRLNNSPVLNIDRLTAEVSVATTLTRQGAVNGTDPIPARYAPVVAIQKIEQIADSKVYVPNVDYVLESDTVRWLQGGQQPDLGATYDITFTYNKQMLSELDYSLTVENGIYYVELLSGGDKPIANTQMQIDYNFYLYYIASITMDRYGLIRVVKGQPDTTFNVRPPDISDQSVLLMGYVRVAPVNDTLVVNNSNTVRLSMVQLQRMFARLEDMEYNQAVTDLDKEALEGEDVTQLKGILTDGFLGFTKSDINHHEYDAAINPDMNFLTLGFTTQVNDLSLDVTKADQYNTYDRIVTGKSSEYIHSKQPHATKSHLINPYTEFDDKGQLYNITVVPISGAIITTTPARQARVGEIVTVNVNITEDNMEFKEILIDGAFMTGNSFTMPNHNVTVTAAIRDVTPIPPPKHNITVIPIAEATITTTPAFEATQGSVVKVNIESLMRDFKINSILINGTAISGDTFTMPNHHVTVTATAESLAPKSPPTISIVPSVDNWIDERRVTIPRDGGTTVVNTIIDSTSRTRVSTSTSSSVMSTAIQFMRIRTINVVGERFKPLQDNIIIKFNDIRVTATPESEKYRSSRSGYLKADENGIVKASIQVQDKTRCGTVGVSILTEDYSHLTGDASYTAKGTLRTTTTTVTTSTTVFNTRTSGYTDPLAQTFSFSTDEMLTSVGLFFSKLDPAHTVTLQIRETNNAYPANIILSEVVIPNNILQASENGSVETKINLPDPVYCKADTQYALTILTHSTKASVYIQTLGGVDLISNEQVVQNPYVPGVMFTSSNALTWTAHQTENVKFNLYANNFNTLSMVYFNPIMAVDYDRIQLRGETSVPIDTKLEWEYSPNLGTTWLPLSLNEDLQLPTSVNSVTLRATINAKRNVSPSILMEGLILIGSKNSEHSSYVTRNVKTDVVFRNAKVVADVYTPSGTGVVFYYATDINGSNWKTLTQQGEGKIKQEDGYIEYTYVATEDVDLENFRAKAELTTNNTTVRPTVKNLKCIMK